MGQIRGLRVTTLAENLVQAGGLGQWGLSLMLELVDARGEGRVIVFDTGANREALLHNVKLLKKDLGEVDCVVLSHGHPGPVNTLGQVMRLGGFERIHGLIGGTHLVGRSDDYLEQTMAGMRGFGLGLISPCHCTGFKATSRLWQAFPAEFALNFCCRVIEAGKEPEPRVI